MKDMDGPDKDHLDREQMEDLQELDSGAASASEDVPPLAEDAAAPVAEASPDEPEPKTDTPEPEKVKRPPGRPKGYPKAPNSGRRSLKDMTTQEIRAHLLKESRALEVLSKIVRGEKLYAGSSGDVGKDSWRRPSVQQRIRAIELLLEKCLPSLQSTELSGSGGAPLIPKPEATDLKEMASAVYSLLRESSLRTSVETQSSEVLSMKRSRL